MSLVASWSALCLYAGTAAFVPLLHAQTQVLVASAPAVEGHHSEQCPVVHNDAACPSCGAHGFPSKHVWNADFAIGTRAGVGPSASRALSPGRVHLATHPVRAPPSG